MKLILHELKIELRHRWWLILIWWLLVGVDLAYQLDWWGEGTSVIDVNGRTFAHDYINRRIASFIQFGIWGGLALFPLLLFSEISPSRSCSMLRLRPVRDRNRFFSRIIFLFLAVGTPLLLQEAIAVSAIGDFTFWQTLRAILERSLLLSAIWFGAGLIAWVSGRLWTSAIVTALTTLGYLTLHSPFTSPFAGQIDKILKTYSGISGVLITSEPRLGALPSLVLAILIFSLGLSLWKRNRFSTFAKTAMLSAFSLCLALSFTSALESLLTTFARNEPLRAKFQKSLEFRFVANSTHCFYGDQDGRPEPYWFFKIESKKPSDGIVTDLREVSGVWKWGDSAQLDFVQDQISGGHYQRLPKALARKMTRRKIAITDVPPQFVDGGGTRNGHYPLGGLKAISGKGSFPKTQPDSAEAKCQIALWKTRPWKTILFDGSETEFGSFGKAKVTERNIRDDMNLDVTVQFTRPEFVFSNKKSRQTRKWVLLYNQQSGECFWMSLDNLNQGMYLQRGRFPTAAPRRKLTISTYQQGREFPIKREQNWFKNTKFFLVEADFVGEINKTILGEMPTVERRSLSYRLPIELFQKLSDEEIHLLKKELSTLPKGITKQEIRKHNYRLAMVTDIGKGVRFSSSKTGRTLQVKKIPETARGTVREIVTRYPKLGYAYKKAWSQSDKEWFLKEIGKSNSRKDLLLIGLAANQRWLDDRPEEVTRLLNQFGSDGYSFLLPTAVKLDLPNAKEIRFKSILSKTWWGRNIPNPDEFPELWQEAKLETEARWTNSRSDLAYSASIWFSVYSSWHDGIALARMGDPEPLRELLSNFIVISQLHPGSPTTTPHLQAWEYLSNAVSSPDIPNAKTKKQRIALAEEWLKSEWEYDASTLTFRIRNQ